MSELTDLLAAVQLLLTRAETILNDVEVLRVPKYAVDTVADLAALTPEAGDSAVVTTGPSAGHLFVYIEAVWQDLGPFKGDAGADGKTIRNGTGAPLDALGVDGDFYIDTTNDRFYGPKAAGAWPGTFVSLIGPQGDAGWSPVLAAVVDGARRVHQVVDWIGGEGTKPATGSYVGPAGLVATAAEAADIRGPQGDVGDQGPSGTITVGSVTASAPGSTPEVTNSGTSEAAIFDFVLPRGDEGPQGPIGPSASLIYDFSTSTVDGDPGTGQIRLNNTDLALVTEIYLNNAETSGVDVSAYTDTWDDADNPVKGTILLRQVTNAGRMALYAVTAVTAAAGYRKLTVTYLDGSSASFTGGGVQVGVAFFRSGDAGADGAGTGTVQHTGAPTAGQLARFADGSGDLIEGSSGIDAGEIVSGVIDPARLPAIAVTDVYVVADEAAMLALTAQRGDVAIRTDLPATFILATESPSTLADWKQFPIPTDTVLSVAGLTGAISASSLRTALSLVVGTDVQAYSAILAALAGLTPSADKAAYFTGASAMALATVTAYGRSLWGAADAAAAQALIGAAASTDLLRDMTRVFLKLAELQANQMGAPNGVADDFSDTDGVDAAASTGETWGSGKYSSAPPSTSLVPTMTGNTAPAGYVATASSTYSTRSAYKAFDGSLTGNENRWQTDNTDVATLEIELPSAVEVTAYALHAPDSGTTSEMPKTWTFEGWNGSSWDVLDTRTAVAAFTANEARTFTLSAPGTYSRFRINITDNQSGAGYTTIQELRLLNGGGAIDLRSVAYSALAAPSRAHLIAAVKASASFTLNTQLKGYVSRDGGTTWTQVTLVAREALTGGFTMYEAVDVDISAQPSGTSMKWRIEGLIGRVWEITAAGLFWNNGA